MSDDMRDYYRFYGIYTDDWQTIWGGQTYNHHLVKNMISDYCNSTASTTCTTNGVSFIFPHNLKQNYFLEGVVEGEITFGNSVASKVSDFIVSIFKHNSNCSITILATTGTKWVQDSIPAKDAMSYHFWMDVFDSPKEITEYDRLGVKIEWNISGTISGTSAKLQHAVVTSDYDFWIDIPLMLS